MPEPSGVGEVPGMKVPFAAGHPSVQTGRDRAAGKAEGEVPRCRQSGAISARTRGELLDRWRPVQVRQRVERRGVARRQILHAEGAAATPRSARSSHSWYQRATARTCGPRRPDRVPAARPGQS